MVEDLPGDQEGTTTQGGERSGKLTLSGLVRWWIGQAVGLVAAGVKVRPIRPDPRQYTRAVCEASSQDTAIGQQGE